MASNVHPLPAGRRDAPAAQDPSPDLDQDMARLFADWEEQEAKVDLSDIKPQDAIVFALFWLLFGVVFLQFFTRYVLNDSLGWTEEIGRFLLIGVTFVGSVTAMRKGSHIAVEALLVFLPERAKRAVLIVVDGLVALFTGAMAWYAYELGNRAPGYMVSIDVPKSVVYWGVAASLAAMTIHAAARFVRRLLGRQPVETHGSVID